MIDPINMTRYGQTQQELEETLLFCVSVAGKNAVTTAKCLDKFLDFAHLLTFGPEYQDHVGYSPFEAIAWCDRYKNGGLAELIKACGLGCYNQRARTFRALVEADLNLKTCTIEDLEKIPGIGPKTSRFFVLHTREGAEVAVIDTHLLKHLAANGYPIPTKTSKTGSTSYVQPASKKVYAKYEQWLLDLWRSESNLTLAEYDLNLWNYYAGHSEEMVA